MRRWRVDWRRARPVILLLWAGLLVIDVRRGHLAGVALDVLFFSLLVGVNRRVVASARRGRYWYLFVCVGGYSVGVYADGWVFQMPRRGIRKLGRVVVTW